MWMDSKLAADIAEAILIFLLALLVPVWIVPYIGMKLYRKRHGQ